MLQLSWIVKVSQDFIKFQPFTAIYSETRGDNLTPKGSLERSRDGRTKYTHKCQVISTEFREDRGWSSARLGDIELQVRYRIKNISAKVKGSQRTSIWHVYEIRCRTEDGATHWNMKNKRT